MSAIINKQMHIIETRAEDFEQMAAAQGTTELSPVPHSSSSVFHVDRDEIVSIVGTPMDPARLCRIEE